MAKGIIALDIDGTIATKANEIPAQIITTLHYYEQAGWHIIFITGRTFAFSLTVLQKIPFPFHLAVQNGSVLLQMPSRQILAKKYLKQEIITQLENFGTKDFLLCFGPEQGGVCYYRPQCYSPDVLQYLMQRQLMAHETWASVNNFDALPAIEFPLIKWFAPYEILGPLMQRIMHQLAVTVSIIHDPFHPSLYIAQATHQGVSKGWALQQFCNHLQQTLPIIAAGDDFNDQSMLSIADVKIVIETAPQELLQMANIVAKEPQQEGLIVALTQACKLV